MKKTLAGIILGLLLSGVIYAAPLTDYSRGSAQVDFGVGYNSGSANDPYNSPSLTFGNGVAANGAITVGLGDELAVRLRLLYANSVAGSGGDNTITVNSITLPVIEIVWQCIPFERSPVAVALSVGFDEAYLNWSSGSMGVFGPSMPPRATFGIQAVGVVSDEIKVYANADLGLWTSIAGAGVSYAVAKDTDINLGVNAVNCFPIYKDEAVAIATRNITSIMPYCSLSYRFVL